ncbi:protein CFAP20DC isoform X1 [Octopus bimaculoides]|uniref:CFA20 domain-containing protein n=1 Tax=Octopus bimaculoides TaxID=37653 RepID=A0A0L8GR73_OCTBM|nr:protein CFAP20DC isoform X1 [Octopus bimaculoides]XP_052822874.1 protein CFAP20DC isoform X1 [Octopus bimaculoides]|eukprot:XP_014778712.1 PREDICTED: uncharacterized protein C3orf67 homolog isoform X1 [Octopus bimaculoides]
MYKNEYQGGSFFEIFSSQGKDATANWKLVGGSGIRKIYEKEVKGYIYNLEGSTSTTKMILPKDSRQSLVLIQHFLIFQLFLGRGQDFSLELGLIDLGNNKRRILLSTAQREIQCTPLHAKVPLLKIKRGVWINLCVDLVSAVNDLWKNQTFKAVDIITVSASCRLRRIFTMKLPPYETPDENEDVGNCQLEFDYIPKQCQFVNDVQTSTQIINIRKIQHEEKLNNMENGNISWEASGNRNEFQHSSSMSDTDSKTKKLIAFGSKTSLPVQRKSSKERLSVEKNVQSTSSKIAGTSMLFKPHPPREPSTEKNRRKIRVKSTSSDRQSNSASSDGATNIVLGEDLMLSVNNSELCNVSQNGLSSRLKNSSMKDQNLHKCLRETKGINKNSKSPDFQQGNKIKESSKRSVQQQRSSLNQGQDIKNENGSHANSLNSNTTKVKRNVDNKRQNKHQAQSVSKEKPTECDEPDIQLPRKPVEMDESLSAIIAMLKDRNDLNTDTSDVNQYIDEHNQSSDNEDGIRGENSDQSDYVYLFTSSPKSAPKYSHSPVQENDSAGRVQSGGKVKGGLGDLLYSARGAKPEDDFVLSDSDEERGKTRVKLGNSRSHTSSATSSRGSSSKSVHAGSNSRTNILLPEKGESLPIHSQTVQQYNSASNNHSQLQPGSGLKYNSANYVTMTDPSQVKVQPSQLSRLSRKSLREVSSSKVKPLSESTVEKIYDSNKYQTNYSNTMDSCEELVLASMKRQQEEEFALHQRDRDANSNVNPMALANHLYEDSTTTTSDDDTFSSLKVPLPVIGGHNYKEEMKYPSRRSTDTLSSSNPRDWNVFSPPIVLPSELQQKEQFDVTLSARMDEKTLHNQCQMKFPRTSCKFDSNNKCNEEELDLLYDPVLGYYYDPKTNKYYELK